MNLDLILGVGTSFSELGLGRVFKYHEAAQKTIIGSMHEEQSF